MTLWVPRGPILIPDAPPEADARMINFVGLNHGGHTGYHELRRRTEQWARTGTTPDGPAGLLRVTCDAFCYGYYSYALLAVAGCWSILAIEASLRLRLKADRMSNFDSLVRDAKRLDLLPHPGWDASRINAGRKLRNGTLHGDEQSVWTPAMAEQIVRASHEAVAVLFPDEPPLGEAPTTAGQSSGDDART
jgi:hypothetical protein